MLSGFVSIRVLPLGLQNKASAPVHPRYHGLFTFRHVRVTLTAPQHAPRGCCRMADFFRIESQQTLHVVELTLPELIDPLEFDRLNDAMLAELDGRADQRWVLDLGRVHYMGSAMLGLMVNVRQRVKAGGGKLVLCAMSPRLQEIFRACSMERLFTIVRTRDDAMRLTAGR